MTDTKYGVHGFVNWTRVRLKMLRFRLKLTSNFFCFVFLGKIFYEKIHLNFCSWIFSELKIDTKTILPYKVRQECWLLFGQSKFPSWSMTPSGFCQKYIFPFSQKSFFIHFFLVLSSKYRDLILDNLTRFWDLEYTQFVAPSADYRTFLLKAKRDMPSCLCFFVEGVFRKKKVAILLGRDFDDEKATSAIELALKYAVLLIFGSRRVE